MKELIKKIIGDKNIGILDVIKQPYLKKSWGGPFNGQLYRQRIFMDLMHITPFNAIVETGTYRGTTTALFIATGINVYTTEISKRNFGFSKFRFLLNRDNARFYNLDSRVFLNQLTKEDELVNNPLFFYLDAHWEDDLPLKEELDIIFANFIDSVVMIDDFQVKNDDGYNYDDYGNNKSLTIEYISDIIDKYNLSAFFPNTSSQLETGAKRGCIVLCAKNSEREKIIIDQLQTLKLHS